MGDGWSIEAWTSGDRRQPANTNFALDELYLKYSKYLESLPFGALSINFTLHTCLQYHVISRHS